MSDEIFRADAYCRECHARVVAVDDAGIRLDRTVFYPAGGGQLGDTGLLVLDDGSELLIADTKKGGEAGEILHIPAVNQPQPPIGSQVTARIDWARRYRLMRMHTCLHLLCAVIPAGVTGGQIADGKGRLDFDLSGTDIDLDKAAIEARLNALITADLPVAARWIDDAELAANPQLVRTMSVKPPTGQGQVRLIDVAGTDLQPCGGTHVARTGEIGPITVEKIENKGKKNRRIVLAFA